MLGLCLIFACLGLRSILMLCDQTKTGKNGMLAECLPQKEGILINQEGILINPGRLKLPF